MSDYYCGDWPARPVLQQIVGRVHETSGRELLEMLGPNSVDLIAADPPYGTGSQISHHQNSGDPFTEIAGVDAIDAEWLSAAYNCLRPNSAFYMFAKWRNIGEWERHVKRVGFEVRNWIIWDKAMHGAGDLVGAYAPQYEMILYATKGNHVLNAPRLPDVLRVMKVHPTKLIHPYEKPIPLLRKLIQASSKPGDLVVDPFCGSGSTLYAAQELGRRYAGSDIDPKSVLQASQRLSGIRIARKPKLLTTLPLLVEGEGGAS